jgi:hypothetical protein
LSLINVPLRNDLGAYDFDIELDGEIFLFALRYNYRMSLWILDIRDVDGTDILCGLPLVCGDDLLKEYVKETKPKGKLYVINLTESDVNPDRTALEADAFLYYVESE